MSMYYIRSNSLLHQRKTKLLTGIQFSSKVVFDFFCFVCVCVFLYFVVLLFLVFWLFVFLVFWFSDIL